MTPSRERTGASDVTHPLNWPGRWWAEGERTHSSGGVQAGAAAMTLNDGSREWKTRWSHVERHRCR